MSKNVQLFIIDPQIDFCDPQGALSVPGADKDMERLADMIKRAKSKISDLQVTLDSHRYLHIAHPVWWKDADGNHPAPFTIISSADVEGTNPKWTTTNPGFRNRSIEYIKGLEASGKYLLCIWRPHCLIGSRGHAVYPTLFEALQEWESQFAVVNYVTKGSNIFTEHYSVIKAEVPDQEDPTTLINTDLIQKLQQADLIGIAGEALSHCVANSVRDVADELGSDQVGKFVLLEDASSPVPGFEQQGEDFIKEMKNRGMQISSTKDFL